MKIVVLVIDSYQSIIPNPAIAIGDVPMPCLSASLNARHVMTGNNVG